METKPAIRLAKGGHGDEFDPASPDNCERCMFEAYNWIKYQEFTDSCPPGVSTVLHTFGMQLNDCLPNEARQALVTYLPNGSDPLDGTAADGRDETRSYMALNWLIRTYLLRFLELSPRLAEYAAAVRALAPIRDMAAAEAAGPVVRAARDAARDAAGNAARDAAGNAARDAAWAAAGNAAGNAARDAAGNAARDAAGNAARDAAGDAADKILNPVVVILQESALALYPVMIRGTWDEVSDGV